MNTIGSVKEDLNIEKRISITIETVKKFSSLGFTINIEKNYAKHLGIGDEEYQRAGAILNNSKKEVFEKSDIILNVKCPLADDIDLIKNKSILIGQFDTSNDKDIINKLIKKDIKVFSLNLLPRITRAQSMDVLSSQANLAGYKAVIDSFANFEKSCTQ
jgi:NAD/NADP transhydrogenase alpha subunit